MDNIDNVLDALNCCECRACSACPYVEFSKCKSILFRNVRELLNLLKSKTFSNGMANATVRCLNEEKENAIKEIEERKAFNLKCDGQPEWLRKGIDVGLNTALNILKGKDGEQDA